MRGYPLVKAVPKELKKHSHVRVDNYYWLREREDPEVMDFLKGENEYTKAVMAHTEDLEKTLFQEIKGRIKQTDMSVPYRLDDYFYYSRYEEGKEYPIYARKKGSLDAPEEIIIDANVLAEGHEFFSVDTRSVSFNQDILAYAVDTKGRRIYTVHFKNLNTGELLKDIVTDVTGNMDWANDNKTLFYSKQDPTTLRSYQIFRHVLGTESSEDQLVYEETDDTFSIFVFRTKSKKYMMIVSTQTLSHEYRYLDANDPNGDFTVFLSREREHEYQIDHFQDKFFIRTNDQAKNFRLMATPIEKTGKEHWHEVIPHRNDVFLENFEIFKEHLVLEERKGGLIQIRVIPWAGSGEHSLEFDEPAYHAHISINLEFDTPILRFGYTSMTTPNSIYDYNMVTRDRVRLKQEEILGGFDSQNYITERLHARAEDGTEIPISIVYRKGYKKDGQSPLVLYGYGSYGLSMDASFNSPRLSLIDRGFSFAIAHIRGGEEFGRQWYEDGKLLKKKIPSPTLLHVGIISSGRDTPVGIRCMPWGVVQVGC